MSEKANRIILILIFTGVVLGALCGLYFPDTMKEIKWIGGFFLDALKMMIVPLVMLSMITGVAGLGSIRHFEGMGVKTLVYYLITTFLSVLLGLILVNIIQPGAGIPIDGTQIPDIVKDKQNLTFTGVLVQVVSELISPNIIKSMTEQKIMPLIIFSLLMGGVLLSMGEKAASTIKMLTVLNEAILKMVQIVLIISPIGIFALIASRIGEAGGWAGFSVELIKVGKYSFTVIIGLLIHAVIILPLFLRFLGRQKIGRYTRGMLPALTTAFSTASSSATLPVTIECAEENNGISNKVGSFVLSLGSTVNMDGTALYEAVAALFIAQAYNVDLTLAQQVIIFLTATLASIGAAGIPQAGMVTMVMVLQAVNLPLEGMGLILAVDWFLDRWRTTVNVWGDAVGAAVIQRFEDSRAS